MKTTLDLPEALVTEVKRRARRKGQKLKDTVVDLLRKGLAAAEHEAEAGRPPLARDKETGLPLIECKHAAPASERLTPDRVADILLAQETQWHHDAGR